MSNLSTSSWTAWPDRSGQKSNGCSTPAPRSIAAKQWFEQRAQKKVSVARAVGAQK